MKSAGNRRRLFTSSETIANPISLSLDADLESSLHLLSILEASTIPSSPTSPPKDKTPPRQEADASINHQLHHALSLHSQVSTSSSAAEREHRAQANEAHSFRKIGAGACGAIFAQEGKSVVVKLAKDPNSQELWNDFQQHRKISRLFNRVYHVEEVRVPKLLGFVPPKNSEFWDAEPGLTKAAENICTVPTYALLAERILPLPRSTRHLLIEKYCAPRGKQKALADPANNDCLVRVYLGSTNGKSSGMFFSLRNLKLHLNQLIELNLDIEALASRMGIALAVMHWGANTDARDVEFVLGSSSTKKATLEDDLDNIEDDAEARYVGPSTYRGLEDFFCRETEMWVLDFNQVRNITLDDAGVALAVEAVKLNDPYFPKPLKESEVEKHAWKAFTVSYLENSTTILEEALKNDTELGGEILALPRKFVLGLIELEKERMTRREGANA
ncbi:zinc finger protein-domain-containing protein [Neurospora hispaniola]|uniref:Zinc finger protein-domain-containing protein n=1 Tax=Neurospora hispaniola TaxID=588809 RepID=A0AAJ0ICW5_9PEZI|nr:zinc finger protein-domain-containing protein [Neurospora hispaniola]